MKPIYLLLLLLIACGFFACTTDQTQDATEIMPTPEGKTLDAFSFTEFTDVLVDFDVFDEVSLQEEGDYGAGDFRLYYDEDEELILDPLTEGAYLEAKKYTDPLALLPARHWAATIELGFVPESANRLNNWLMKNFDGKQSIDLRIIFVENGTVLFQGIPTTEEALVDFPDKDWF
jgi:hypothetical protein